MRDLISPPSSSEKNKGFDYQVSINLTFTWKLLTSKKNLYNGLYMTGDGKTIILSYYVSHT